jgi:hypothetical protein
MRSVILLAVHILVVLAKVLRPGGIKAIIAENLLLKKSNSSCWVDLEGRHPA